MKAFLLTLLLSVSILFANAQSVGLVLSGGGAKGLAHIGVIRAMEENNIPIDYISGTSMGAIVGGLYAAGYTPDEMEELFQSEQFMFWATGKIQEEYRYYFRKLEQTPAWLNLDLQKTEDRLKILLPTNIIPEEQIDFAFMEMFSSTNAVCNYDFNNLMVPFLCIATDIYENKEVELRDGDLGEAIRASMTFPLYFKPITIDGVLVFDGGIVNNFPVKNTIEAFQPDIIIGHKVANNSKQPSQDDVMAQLENMIMQKTDYEVPENKGLLLETSFSNVNLLDFNKILTIEEAGYKTTLAQMDSIKMLIKRRVSQETLTQKRRNFNLRKPELLFQNIQVEGVTDPMQRKYIIQSVKHKNNVINLDELRHEYFKLVADPQLRSIRPVSFYNKETGYFDLHLKVTKEKSLEIKFGGNVSTKPINQGFLSLDYLFFDNRAYTLSTNIYFGRFYSSIKAGGRIDFPTSLPFYLSGYLTLNRWDFFTSSNEFFFEDVSSPYIIQDENNVRFELGFPVKTHGKLTLGTSFSSAADAYYFNESIKKDDSSEETKFDAFSTKISFERNSQNYKQYATEGLSSELNFTYTVGSEKHKPGTNSPLNREYNGSQDYYTLKAKYERYYPISRNFSLGFEVDGVFSNKKFLNNYTATMLAANTFSPTPFSQTLFMKKYRANKYLASGLKTIFNLSNQMHFRLEGYSFTPAQEIILGENFQAAYASDYFSTLNLMAMGGLVYHSGLGPLSLTLNYFDKENTKFYVVFSFGYVLFNKRGY
ncbi:patatin-like phospholipase family protein [Sunxiuqinia rutila]|uniref:patatin-like phospholipase family protein n=1 Tax=Sunxiuqinia rutila TaxID=1397841 RepID=UPI003D367044